MSDEPALEVDARHPEVARPGGIAFLILGILFWLFFVGGAFFPGAAIAGPIPAIICAVFWMLPIPLGPLLGRTVAKVSVGNDGFTVRSFGRTRFISYRDVKAHIVEKDRVVLRLRNGKVYYLQIATKPYVTPVVHTEHPTVVRIQAGIAAARREREPIRQESDLSRADKSERAWLDAIEHASHESEEYREAAIDREALAKLSADPHADPSVRAASALVLRKVGLQGAEKEALGAAAKATAHPQVRVALEAAADEELAEIEVAKAVARVRR